MRTSVTGAALALTAALAASCRRAEAPPPLAAQVSGTIEVAGLSEPVRVVRDRWGVPHVYAKSESDLFEAQGFVQAEDRLFQMDLWRRGSQGRLAEVLGPNFIERDAMTRRIQYHGDEDADWASTGSGTKAIATAFVRGINAWVAIARQRPPEQFVLAGWKPDYWSPVDLLNRTDAFLESSGALDQARSDGLGDAVVDAIRRVGTAPFFIGLAGPVRATTGIPGGATDRRAEADRIATDRGLGMARSAGHLIATRERVELTEQRPRFDHPSSRYFIHLQAPGWNVAGAISPWLPGVAVGHNDRAAWGMLPADSPTQEVYVEPAPATGAPATRIVTEAIKVKGRNAPFVLESVLTAHGVVVATDRERHRVFTLRWSGSEPGAATGLAALDLDRARNWTEFRAALARWRLPPRAVAYADRDGTLALQTAGLVPQRRGTEWTGWLTLDDLPHAIDPQSGRVTLGDRSVSSTDPAVFTHVLAITAAARRRFTIGPLDRPSRDDGPVRATFVLNDWDRAQAVNAPGQSEAPDSPHFADLARLWSAGTMFPLAFSDNRVEASAEATLVMMPAQRTR